MQTSLWAAEVLVGVVNLASEQEEGEGSPWGCRVGAEQRARDHRGLQGLQPGYGDMALAAPFSSATPAPCGRAGRGLAGRARYGVPPGSSRRPRASASLVPASVGTWGLHRRSKLGGRQLVCRPMQRLRRGRREGKTASSEPWMLGRQEGTS